MDQQTKNIELKTIYQEYIDFFPSIELKLTTGLLASINDAILSNRTSHLKITTSENTTFKISVDLKGWFVIGKEDCYETFETLMGQISPLFSKSFGHQLTTKLMSLQQD